MAEDDNEFEEEFEFESEDIFDDETDGATDASSEAAPVAERKKGSFPWIIVAIVVGVGGYFGWQFYKTGMQQSGPGEIVSAPPEQPATSEEPVETLPMDAQLPGDDSLDQQLETIAEPPAPPPVAVEEPEPEAEVDVEKVVSESKEELEKSLGALKKDVTELTKSNTTKISEMEKDIELTANKIVNVDKTLTALQQDIVKMTKILKTLTEDVNELQSARQAYKSQQAAQARRKGLQEASAATRSSSQRGPQVSQSMTIHAIIPGRAWIRTQDGKTLSVAEGDMLGEYGKVLKIDAPTGTVVTTSGVTIR